MHELLQTACNPRKRQTSCVNPELEFAQAAQLQDFAWPSSEEVSLLHDPQELLLVHLTVSIAVGLVDHLLKLLVGHPFPELLGNPLQVFEGDFACLVVVVRRNALRISSFGSRFKIL